MTELPLERIDDQTWQIPLGARPGMRVPARVFADQELVRALQRDRSLEQLANVATLPGITTAALAMPDVHQGYGSQLAALPRPRPRTARSLPAASATTSTVA
jgi:tRNA-splicing ligase RtcB